MSAHLERTLATRFLLSRRRRSAVSVASLLAILGMAFGVAALLVTLSVISGFQREYKKSILGFNAHLVILKEDGIEDLQGLANRLEEKSREKGLCPLVGWSPFIYREGMLVSHSKVRGIVLKGIDFDRFGALSHIPIQQGKETVADGPAGGADGAGGGQKLYLGRDLQQEFPAAELRVLFPPKEILRFRSAGTFQSGLYEYDSSFAFLDLKEAQKIFGMGDRVTGIEVWLNDPDRADRWVQALEKEFRYPTLVMSWHDLNENIFKALELEKVVFYILMFVLIAVASLNVLGTLVMLILEKRHEIAVLRALGMPWRRLRRVFLWEGVLIGFLGTAVGMLLGLTVLFLIGHWRPIPLAPEIYFVKSVPVFYSWRNFFWVSATSLLLVVVGCELTLGALRRIPILRTLVETP